MGIWDDVEKRLQISTQHDDVKKPKVEDLDQFERENGFKLPDDYREYALTFGPGAIGSREWFFATPGFPGKGNDLEDLATSRESWRKCRCDGVKDEALSKQFGMDADRVRRLVPFCNQRLEGEGFAWDTSDVTDPDRHEYGIYHHTDCYSPIKRVASTFREFVRDYALGGGFERTYFRDSPDTIGDLNRPDPIFFQQASIPTDEE
jgi:SMI1 / KNR4 family (SUKH-1)